MRAICLALALVLSTAVLAQDAKKKQQKKQAKQQQAAHKKPTAEQIRKFNELEKKQK